MTYNDKWAIKPNQTKQKQKQKETKNISANVHNSLTSRHEITLSRLKSIDQLINHINVNEPLILEFFNGKN